MLYEVITLKGFNDNDYNLALKSFEDILEIQSLPLMQEDPPTVDTVIIFNAGLAAYNAENYEKAIKYYKEAAKYRITSYNVCYTKLLRFSTSSKRTTE